MCPNLGKWFRGSKWRTRFYITYPPKIFHYPYVGHFVFVCVENNDNFRNCQDFESKFGKQIHSGSITIKTSSNKVSKWRSFTFFCKTGLPRCCHLSTPFQITLFMCTFLSWIIWQLFRLFYMLTRHSISTWPMSVFWFRRMFIWYRTLAFTKAMLTKRFFMIFCWRFG